MPGAPGGEGVPGGIPGGPGAPGAGGQAPPAGTPEHTAYQFVLGITKGEFASLESHISPKALGQLKELRTNSLSDSKKEELKGKFGQPALAAQKGVGGGKELTLRNGNTFIKLTVKKEGSDYKVTDMSITQARR